MRYFFDINDLPPKYKKKLKDERAKIDNYADNRKKLHLELLEDEYLHNWNQLKNKIDILDKIRQPNIREEILICRFELTVYNESLKYLHERSPYFKKSKMPKRELVL